MKGVKVPSFCCQRERRPYCARLAASNHAMTLLNRDTQKSNTNVLIPNYNYYLCLDMSPWFETTSSFRRSTAPSQVTGKFIVAVIKSAASSQPLGGLFLKIFLMGFVNMPYHMASLRKWRAPHATWRSNTVLDPHATRLPHKHSLGHMRAKHKSPSPPPDEDFHHRSTRSRRPAVPVPSYLDRGGPKIPFWHPRFAAFGSAGVADQMSPPPKKTRGTASPNISQTHKTRTHAHAHALHAIVFLDQIV